MEDAGQSEDAPQNKILELIKESSKKIREIAGEDTEFEKSGLVKAVYEGTDEPSLTEFVHPNAKRLFQLQGSKCFEMARHDVVKQVAESKAETTVELKLKEAKSKMKQNIEKEIREELKREQTWPCSRCNIM
eukprot:CAMPEP_0116151666 /NCGR_PEP_ID=MMETSP0329-20121206/20224_1 /TAXON_ID=697910 /ORGANISM="Pseudo-nitzschia arenysensis, Strain B593" /LENGTH=131 /DNA_ID=CAMNT_0003648305 /DNA_START=120 /DNA_END=515 /DNA_ORIENTATION=+